MMELITIQKRNGLNLIDKVNNYTYRIYRHRKLEEPFELVEIIFQNGAGKSLGAVAGVSEIDLLEIVRDRLSYFQASNMSNRETAIALTKVEEALLWLNKRVEDRAEQQVLGTME